MGYLSFPELLFYRVSYTFSRSLYLDKDLARLTCTVLLNGCCDIMERHAMAYQGMGIDFPLKEQLRGRL